MNYRHASCIRTISYTRKYTYINIWIYKMTWSYQGWEWVYQLFNLWYYQRNISNFLNYSIIVACNPFLDRKWNIHWYLFWDIVKGTKGYITHVLYLYLQSVSVAISCNYIHPVQDPKATLCRELQNNRHSLCAYVEYKGYSNNWTG